MDEVRWSNDAHRDGRATIESKRALVLKLLEATEMQSALNIKDTPYPSLLAGLPAHLQKRELVLFLRNLKESGLRLAGQSKRASPPVSALLRKHSIWLLEYHQHLSQTSCCFAHKQLKQSRCNKQFAVGQMFSRLTDACNTYVGDFANPTADVYSRKRFALSDLGLKAMLNEVVTIIAATPTQQLLNRPARLDGPAA